MAFWGVVLKPGASKGVEQSQGDVMHLSQACLHDPKEGKNYLMAKVGNSSFSLACFEKGKKEHDTFDLFFSSEDCVFTNKGQSEIHLTGYFEPDGMIDDEDDESEDMQPVKGKAAAAATSPKAVAASSPKVAAAISPKVIAAAKAAAAAAADDSDDEEDEEEEEEEMTSADEDEESESEASPAKAASPKIVAAAKASPKVVAAAKAAAAADSDDEDDEESEEGSLLEDEESEEEMAAAKAAAGLDDDSDDEDEESEEESAPPPAKKAKTGAPAAAASPAKKAAGSPTDKWAAAIHTFLKKNGKKNLSDIGTSVPRPADVPKMKMKQLFEQHKDKFTVTGDTVSAK